ncbi:hypothetical protein EMCRGX_G033088 [Ephydatia muelleri]
MIDLQNHASCREGIAVLSCNQLSHVFHLLDDNLSIWDTTAAPGLLDDWNCAHPVKIPFGWEGQLHECQQQFCVDLSLLVDHLTFVVGCFDNCCVHCPIKRVK